MYRRMMRTMMIVTVLCGGIYAATSESVLSFVFAESKFVEEETEHVETRLTEENEQTEANQIDASRQTEQAQQLNTETAEEKQKTDEEHIVATVLSYVDTEREDDPLMEWDNDIWVKESNVHGVEYEGETYYYSLIPHMSYDPLALEEVTFDDIAIIYEEDGAFPVLIYTLE